MSRGPFPEIPRCLTLFIWPLALVLFTQAILANEWEPVFDADNLVVERRPYRGSVVQEIKGVVRLQASLNAVMALLKDADFNQDWVYRSGGATVLAQQGYSQAYVYGVVEAPWPMQDRDSIVRFDYSQQPDTGEITITITNFPNYAPENKQFVRVPDFGGHWNLCPLEDGWVEVTYQIYGDPGGWIPTWAANYAAVTSVTKTLQNMGTQVGRYMDARSEFVNEAPTRSGD